AEGHVHKPAAGGGGGGTTIIVQKDDATIEGAATTIDFDDTDAGGLVSSSPAGEANVNMALYALPGGRVGGQTIIGGTVDNTFLSLQGNSIDLTDPVKLLSPLRMAASVNNYIQDSAGNRHLTFVSDATSVAVTSTFAGSLKVLRFLGVGGGISTNIRMIVQTWGNLAAATNQMIQVNLSGVQT